MRKPVSIHDIKTHITLNKKFYLILFIAFLSPLFSFIYKVSPQEEPQGIFTCLINDKPFKIEKITASMRNITGGERQLSLSNDRFIKFMFLNPTPGTINLTQPGRAAYIRYEDPASTVVCKPKTGFVNLLQIDEEQKTLSGDFEMELVMNINGGQKTIKVTKGKLINIPIVYK